jgi:hypothetical protein
MTQPCIAAENTMSENTPLYMVRPLAHEVADDTAHRLYALDARISALQSDTTAIKATLMHVPTKLWIASWGLAGTAAACLALWRVVAALLDTMGGQLAADIAKALAH